GFFVQWIECSAVLLVGYAINVIRGFPPFQWIAAIGGVLYATGNIFAVPVVNGLGMGVAFLIWGSMQIIVGWSVSRFGLFGFLGPTKVKNNVMNNAGMVITLIRFFSGVLFILVKHTDGKSTKSLNNVSYTESSVTKRTTGSKVSESAADEGQFPQKLPYVPMAMLLAILHGLMMTPIGVLKQNNPSTDTNQVFDYMWSFYSTVFVASTIYFVLYCIIRREKAYVHRELVVPSVGYGLLWASGMTLWLVSGHMLSQVVAYPVITRLPAIISAILDVVVYKSITGRNNLIFLASAVGVGLTGVILIALSNQSF
ncbi:hypothetical protein Angca_009900, partial [Angiostrongylus cantonensis]